MAIWLTGQGEEERRGSEDGERRKVTRLFVCLPEHSSIKLYEACSFRLISLWCILVCDCVCVSLLRLSACGPNEGCLQYNERCGQIMEEVITPACSSHWVRITLLISQMLQQDRPGRDAKIVKGEKSAPKINSSSVDLPIKAAEWGAQVSGERVCTNTPQLSNSPRQGTSAGLHLQWVCSDPNSSTEQGNVYCSYTPSSVLTYILHARLKWKIYSGNI